MDMTKPIVVDEANKPNSTNDKNLFESKEN